MLKKKPGFTIIELLVVIAIIGLLATLSVVLLSNASAKSRDAKRLSHVKQIAKLIELAATESASGNYMGILPAPCNGVYEKFSTANCIIYGVNVTTMKDPVANGTGSTCRNSLTTPCDYAETVDNATTDNYEICFYLEAGIGGLTNGIKKIGPGGVISNGCSN